MAAYKRAYYEQYREQVVARSKEWAEDNLEKVKRFKANNGRKRRAAKNASKGHFTVEEFDALCSAYGYACLCCGATDRILEADHMVPLTKGGSDDSVIFSPCAASVIAANSRQLSTAGDRL